MKTSILALLALFFTFDVAAQVIFRNDFVLTRKRVKSLGLSNITINLNRYPNFNQLVNGRGGRTLVIDVRALRGTKTQYTYAEIAEKIYMPPVFTGPVTHSVPMLLLITPAALQYHVYNTSLNHYHFFRSLSFRPLSHDL
ncbi:MAG TPA: hypothetical protein VF473_08490 [Cyclobacteriaceae bacterium]